MSEHQIYNYPLYISVIIVSIFEYFVIFYLLIRNVTLRKVVKESTPEIVWKSKHLCLSFLCILHIITIFNITQVLLKHVGATTSVEFCVVVNNLLMIGSEFGRFVIWLVLYWRYRIMNEVLNSRSTLSRCSIVLTRMLVLGPLIVLPFSLATIESQWKTGKYDSCILQQTPELNNIILWLMLTTNVIFFGLFLWQMRLTSKISNLLFESDMLPNNRFDKLAKSAALRNLLVTFCTFFWPLVFYCIIQILLKTGDLRQPEFEQYIVFSATLEELLNMLTNNIALYGVFRDWSIFLSPRRGKGIHGTPLLRLDSGKVDQEDLHGSVDVQ